MTTPLTFDLLVENKDTLSDLFVEYIKKLTNRAMYKPEYDNLFLTRPSGSETGIVGTVKVSLIETILKPMTFMLCWKIHTNGLVEPFDDGSRPSAYARQMFRPYTEPVQKWVEMLRNSGSS